MKRPPVEVLYGLAAIGIFLPPTILGAQHLGDWAAKESASVPSASPTRPPVERPMDNYDGGLGGGSIFDAGPLELPDFGLEEGDAWDPETDPPVINPGAPVPARPQTPPARPETPSATPDAPAVPVDPGTPPGDAPESTEGEPGTLRPELTLGLNEMMEAERFEAGCGSASPLFIAGELEARAKDHSLLMAKEQRQFHDSPPDWGTWPIWGENVATGQRTAAEAHADWMQSPGHATNVLNCDFTYVGFAVAESPAGVTYWTVQFGGGNDE